MFPLLVFQSLGSWYWAGSATAVKLQSLLNVNCAAADGFYSFAPVLVELRDPIHAAIVEVEADKAYLLRMLVLIEQVESIGTTFAEKHPALLAGEIVNKDKPNEPTPLGEVLEHRLREFYYKPAFSAAFLVDPVNFQMNRVGLLDLPFVMMSQSEQDDALTTLSASVVILLLMTWHQHS